MAYCHSTFLLAASAKALALVTEAFELLDLLGEDDLAVVRELISSFSNIKMRSPRSRVDRCVTAITTLYATLENRIQPLCVMADLIRTTTHVVPTAKGWY